MHARYYVPKTGRSLSVDPVIDTKKAIKQPQRWNRYAYVRNNPIGATDPTGKYECQGTKEACQATAHAVDNMRRAATNLPEGAKRDALNSQLSFLGRPDEKNGVFIRVNPQSGMTPGAAGGGLPDIVSMITVRTEDLAQLSLRNFVAEFAGRLSHETQHVLDQFDSGFLRNRAADKALEVNAFTVQSFVNEGLGISSLWGIWTRESGFDANAVERNAAASTVISCAASGLCQ